MLFNKPLIQVEYSDIEKLKDDEIDESLILDYKRQMIDEEKLIKQINAFSNTMGGFLIFGIKETKKKKVGALVFVGDSIEEDVDRLGHLAGELGLLGLPCFMFHEGQDPLARMAFQQIARLSGGAYCPFDTTSAQQLRDLLSAVAVYAAGGRKALADYGDRKGGVVRQLTHQVK